MIEEVKKAVLKLNDEIYFDLEDCVDFEDGLIAFTFNSNGNVIIVKFLGIDLWNSENDERYEINKDMIYEPLEGFLRREANRMIRMIEKLSF